MTLNKMDIDELLKLRGSIETELAKRSDQIRDQLSALGHRNGGRSRLKGIKIAPKYRGPKGETWAGRGAHPRWLTALLAKGRKLESYAIK